VSLPRLDARLQSTPSLPEKEEDYQLSEVLLKIHLRRQEKQ
jgi:hypothetical protein